MANRTTASKADTHLKSLDKETQKLIRHARVLSKGGLVVTLTDAAMCRLCAVAALDLGRPELLDAPLRSQAKTNYYSQPLTAFDEPLPAGVTFGKTFTALRAGIKDFVTYLLCLCEIHKRRKKFGLILEYQPLPKMDHVVPRCLLEYGLRPPEVLASWLVWRKWLYDVDNRSAQETGYLFEPVLANALGGVRYSDKNSPVRRSDEKNKGRQIDCLVDNDAYEFKMRVTIAASGQGRFGEELAYARDCKNSQYVPVLLVLDPTMSTRLADLEQEYKKHGGRAYIGDKAWAHLKEKSGPTMAVFVSKYIESALREVEKSYGELSPISLTNHDNMLEIRVGSYSMEIPRKHDPSLDVVLSED